MLQKAYCPGNLGRNRLDLFFPVQRAVNLYTKGFCFLNDLQIIIMNFQFHLFVLTLERAMFLFCGNEHGTSFCNIQRKFVAFQPCVQFLKVVVDVSFNSCPDNPPPGTPTGICTEKIPGLRAFVQ